MKRVTRTICGGFAAVFLAAPFAVSAEPEQRDNAGKNAASHEVEERKRPPNAGVGKSDDNKRKENAPARPQREKKQRPTPIERQTEQFEETHARRMAELQRLRDLAVENERKDVTARVDGLIGRELERHAKQMDRLQKRKDRAENGNPNPDEEEGESSDDAQRK